MYLTAISLMMLVFTCSVLSASHRKLCDTRVWYLNIITDKVFDVELNSDQLQLKRSIENLVLNAAENPETRLTDCHVLYMYNDMLRETFNYNPSGSRMTLNEVKINDDAAKETNSHGETDTKANAETDSNIIVEDGGDSTKTTISNDGEKESINKDDTTETKSQTLSDTNNTTEYPDKGVDKTESSLSNGQQETMNKKETVIEKEPKLNEKSTETGTDDKGDTKSETNPDIDTVKDGVAKGDIHTKEKSSDDLIIDADVGDSSKNSIERTYENGASETTNDKKYEDLNKDIENDKTKKTTDNEIENKASVISSSDTEMKNKNKSSETNAINVNQTDDMEDKEEEKDGENQEEQEEEEQQQQEKEEQEEEGSINKTEDETEMDIRDESEIDETDLIDESDESDEFEIAEEMLELPMDRYAADRQVDNAATEQNDADQIEDDMFVTKVIPTGICRSFGCLTNDFFDVFGLDNIEIKQRDKELEPFSKVLDLRDIPKTGFGVSDSKVIPPNSRDIISTTDTNNITPPTKCKLGLYCSKRCYYALSVSFCMLGYLNESELPVSTNSQLIIKMNEENSGNTNTADLNSEETVSKNDVHLNPEAIVSKNDVQKDVKADVNLLREGNPSTEKENIENDVSKNDAHLNPEDIVSKNDVQKDVKADVNLLRVENPIAERENIEYDIPMIHMHSEEIEKKEHNSKLKDIDNKNEKNTHVTSTEEFETKEHNSKLKDIDNKIEKNVHITSIEEFEKLIHQKTSEYAPKIHSLELMIMKLENHLLSEKLNKQNHSSTIMRLENLILKLENDLLKIGKNYQNLKEEAEAINKRQNKYLEIASKQQEQISKRPELTDNSVKNYELISVHHDKINELTDILKNQSSIIKDMKNKFDYLEDQNRVLHQMIMNQTLFMTSIIQTVQDLSEQNSKNRQEIGELKNSLQAATETNKQNKEEKKSSMSINDRNAIDRLDSLMFDTGTVKDERSKDEDEEEQEDDADTHLKYYLAERSVEESMIRWCPSDNYTCPVCHYHSVVTSQCVPFKRLFWNSCNGKCKKRQKATHKNENQELPNTPNVHDNRKDEISNQETAGMIPIDKETEKEKEKHTLEYKLDDKLESNNRIANKENLKESDDLTKETETKDGTTKYKKIDNAYIPDDNSEVKSVLSQIVEEDKPTNSKHINGEHDKNDKKKQKIEEVTVTKDSTVDSQVTKMTDQLQENKESPDSNSIVSDLKVQENKSINTDAVKEKSDSIKARDKIKENINDKREQIVKDNSLTEKSQENISNKDNEKGHSDVNVNTVENNESLEKSKANIQSADGDQPSDKIKEKSNNSAKSKASIQEENQVGLGKNSGKSEANIKSGDGEQPSDKFKVNTGNHKIEKTIPASSNKPAATESKQNIKENIEKSNDKENIKNKEKPKDVSKGKVAKPISTKQKERKIPIRLTKDKQREPKDCYDYYSRGNTKDGLYKVKAVGSDKMIEVFCDMRKGGWTVIQRRQDGTTNFFQGWEDYKKGFGGLYGEHWLGNDNMHLLTNQDYYKLRVDLMDWDKNKKYAEFDNFLVESEDEGYRVHIDGYSGDAGDGLTKHDGHQFSTKDVDNDKVVKEFDGSCAKRFHGGGWYYKCYSSNLNGKFYKGGKIPEKMFDGVTWKPWMGPNYSLKKVEMKIRPASVKDRT